MARLSSKQSFERFCFLGTLQPVYDAKNLNKIGIELNEDLEKIILSIDGEHFVKSVQGLLSNKALPKRDVVWFSYAVYILGQTKKTDLTTARNSFAHCAVSQEDFFLFLNYMKIVCEYKKRNLVSKTMRAMVKSWYKNRGEEAQVEMWCSHKGQYGFTHRNVLLMFHVSTSLFSKNKLVKEGLFLRCNKIAYDSTNLNSKKPLDKKVTDISLLRCTESKSEVIDIIEQYKLKSDEVPNIYKKNYEVWNKLIPNMGYEELIKSAYILLNYKILDHNNCRGLYIAALKKFTNTATAVHHPMELLLVKNKFANNAKYYGPMKKEYYYNKKAIGYAIKKKQAVEDVLDSLYINSFQNLEKLPLKISVTINLKKCLKTKTIAKCSYITCYKAALTLAFTLFKCAETDVYSFNDSLLPLAWLKDSLINKADEYCTGVEPKTTYQRNHFPILKAQSEGAVYDLFVIIVPSAALGNSDNKSKHLLETLEKYQTSKNPNAKLIIINLRKLQPTMKHDSAVNNGFLEICGLNETSLKLMRAFALGQFK